MSNARNEYLEVLTRNLRNARAILAKAEPGTKDHARKAQRVAELEALLAQ